MASHDETHPFACKPHIAVVVSASARNATTRPYLEAVIAHGGEACLLRPADDFKSRLPDGLVLSGGGDLGESSYARELSAGERKTIRDIEPDREQHERLLLKWARRVNVPILGICRGCQMLNVFAGGTMVPDIHQLGTASAPPLSLTHHSKGKGHAAMHEIVFGGESMLRTILGGPKRMQVNSNHHQAIRKCGHGLRVVARSADGIIEAIEDPAKSFWIGVQFHPERLWQHHPIWSRIFSAFIQCAAKGARSGGLKGD